MHDSASLLDHPLVSQRYFYPRAAAIPQPLYIKAADGSQLACYYQKVATDSKTVVYFHGNGEVVADYLPEFSDWLTGAGYNVLLAEYRGYGMSTGQPTLVSMLNDVEAMLNHLAMSDSRVVLFGRSIGSLYAVHGVSRRPNIAALIIESGVAAISERFFMRVEPAELGRTRAEITNELHQHFDYAAKLKDFQGRTLILHTRHDELLPVRHAELLYAAAPQPKQLQIFERGGHNDIFYWNRQAYMQTVESFLAAT